MFRCDNCAAWVEDLIRIEWPTLDVGDEPDALRQYESYRVCVDCVEYLQQFDTTRMDTPEIGSSAAQRDYVKGE